MSRSIVIILDGLGVGALPDAGLYGDAGSDTLGHTASVVGGIELPTLQRLGLGNIHTITGVPPVAAPAACFGRMTEISAGKDSTTGHWELMGVVTSDPFPTYPDGFPDEVLEAFTEATGYAVIGNVAASGTEIIQRLGDEHVETGRLIVYTSADSVFQIAAHEDVVPLDDLYSICVKARELLVPPHQVSRVIARPFTGSSGDYRRTPNRHDYSVPPPAHLLLPQLAASGVTITSIGKIADLYARSGINVSLPSKSNEQGMATIAELCAKPAAGDELILLNLVDFDMLWGHRNDPRGMADGLQVFDSWFDGFLALLRPGDLLLLTADHGNDPTTPSTDHSREYVPLLALLAGGGPGRDLGVRATFADFGATLAQFHDLPDPAVGTGFLPLLTGKE